MINLSGKKVLITGGSRGIGKACVELFIKAGADVFFTYERNAKAAKNLLKNVNRYKPEKQVIKDYQMNLSEEGDIVRVIREIVKEFKRIDVLVNNAGIWKYGEADTMTKENWEETIRINLTGTFLVTREVSRVMKKKKYGRIINITSTAGQRGEALHSHYAASKGGVISYTKSLSSELANFNITTNSVAPGWVDTEMCDEVFEDANYKESVRKGIPVGRIATPEDIAGPVLFLASDLARHINGEILNVNGGSVLCG
ncbi:MAG: 3-oxoacyl-ACP reductase FabG [Ignavibacteriales bacterium]|jgi:3-oxoacyl-[acyl-carrier protein] reductase|nr:3-oxoacyl-ACP reductase family protein [Ignavibacteriaceae bacterium]NLH62180.1 3-oxoacyl-ACP reductase FabG [Ignavibacteriales bacterium]HPO56528.1 3-oxoacyl-ACP reductase family protein [Ignavibacteriaceae bacterium]